MKNWYEKIKQGSSGITLISLVVTIIVLLILATVGIYSGISAINSSKLTRFTTQMKLMQLEVNKLYEAYTTGESIETKDGNKYTGEDIATIGKDLSQADQEQLDNIFRPDWKDGSGILNREGYRYFDKETIENLEIEGIDEEFLINVETRTVISYEGLKYDDKMYYTLEQVPDSLYNVDYENPNTGKPIFDISYEQLESGKWKIKISNIRFGEGQEGFINKWQVKYQFADTQEPDKWNISDDLEFIVDVADEYRIIVFQQGIESDPQMLDLLKITIPPKYPVAEDIIFKDPTSNDKEAVIPEGFKVSEEPTEQKIDTGLVVIAPDESEFVWVPVDKETLCADGVEDKEVAEIATGTDYRGVLYNFSGIISTKMPYEDNGNREPAYLTDSIYSDESDNNTIGLTKQMLQDEYNAIIQSIQENGGFYVGRYESSLSDSTKKVAATTGNIQSKKEVMPTSSQITTTEKWYGLYAKQKDYAMVLNQENGTNIRSSMIYGSMYDAVMNWALYGTDKTDADKVTQSSIQHGLEYTCAVPEDRIKNIFDLGNNFSEWTVEATDVSYRVGRGGWFENTNSPSYRGIAYPKNIDPINTTRLVLYL